MVAETGTGLFSAHKITEELASTSLDSGVHLLFDIHDRTFQALPDFLAEHRYQEVNDIRNTVFQKAFDTNLSIYEYLVHHPQLQAHMQDAMKLHQPEGDWLSVFPADEIVGNQQTAPDPARVLFVDIGGGMGQQCIRFRERYPDLAGRVILQDIPQTINRVPKPMPNGIEAVPHSFEDPQPIKSKSPRLDNLARERL
ncbi:O-methyltransferase family 2 [Macrophomina phaseolina MS6]|uniref:O-methyltransferase dpmpI n=1 Tax=Macrophomina phaseolina (strain MS6) TaxID=1126212 RepID=DPMPI_MACPH|nr:RecName: Full=O-methyltransferase dpmpI; AltName: Full=Diterpenoid pyrone biosynthesis cluster protein I [Macrophomina phaseolina MS6]EKG13728.1 O-methyltransferase family 2 [Macrophomina phaseolina MS6]